MPDHFDTLSAEDLEAMVRTAKRRREPEWICQECLMSVMQVSVNIGLPERRNCDICHQPRRTFQIIKDMRDA